jgi:hypothetical protein
MLIEIIQLTGSQHAQIVLFKGLQTLDLTIIQPEDHLRLIEEIQHIVENL